MDTFAILAFTFGLAGLGFAVKNHERINLLEKKLKDFDVIPREFSSEPRSGKQEKDTE